MEKPKVNNMEKSILGCVLYTKNNFSRENLGNFERLILKKINITVIISVYLNICLATWVLRVV